jgi:hypothetical protein
MLKETDVFYECRVDLLKTFLIEYPASSPSKIPCFNYQITKVKLLRKGGEY